jgi:hypothetical protein
MKYFRQHLNDESEKDQAPNQVDLRDRKSFSDPWKKTKQLGAESAEESIEEYTACIFLTIPFYLTNFWLQIFRNFSFFIFHTIFGQILTNAT